MNRWNNLIDLKGDSAPMEVINQRILSDATIEGTNLIVLVMAIMIACIGLNLNSVAIIIGAMLISPLMGGIVATGYGMATYDVPFIRKSLIKLSFQVGLAVLTASIYFLLSFLFFLFLYFISMLFYIICIVIVHKVKWFFVDISVLFACDIF